MLVLIDNYDSFTYNLVQAFQRLGQSVQVLRNYIEIQAVSKLQPSHIVIGPGPGHPIDAGNCLDYILELGQKIPLLGVCLGHQAIAEAFGGKIIKAKNIMHGKKSPIFHQENGLFQGLPQGFFAVRYHSLLIDRDTIPDCLEVTAQTSAKEIMGISHSQLPIHGVQFHPESVATEYGLTFLENFLKTN